MGAPESLTVLDVLRRTEGWLKGRGSATARLDAELLMGSTLGLDRVGVYLAHDRPLAEDEAERMRGLVRRRGAGTPGAYLLGSKEFYGLEFHVDARVLVPRPETEHLVDRALDALDALGPGPRRVVDVGAGCGAVACALAARRPEARVVATELCPHAAAVAADNVRRLVPGDRVRVVRADLLGPIAQGGVDLVVSNPPYVAHGDPDLHPHVAAHEPAAALYGGEDGLAVYRRLLPAAARAIRGEGWLIVEIGRGQAEPVTALAAAAGLGVVDVTQDLAGIPRVLAARPC